VASAVFTRPAHADVTAHGDGFEGQSGGVVKVAGAIMADGHAAISPSPLHLPQDDGRFARNKNVMRA